MATVKLVTGYVHIPDNPYHKRYAKLGPHLLKAAKGHFAAYIGWPLSSCWLQQFLFLKPAKTHSTGDQPKKNTEALHVVLHQKVHWMMMAALEDAKSDVFVWMDYGILYQPGMTKKGIKDFLDKVKNEKGIAIPGCWGKVCLDDDTNPCYRFCGSIIVCHRDWLFQLDKAIKTTAINRILTTQNVTWELNTLARVERDYPNLPLRWYQADHNSSMLENYSCPVVS